MIATSTFGELDPERGNRLMWSFKGKREHVVVRNTPNIAYPVQQIDVQISPVSADASIAPRSLSITTNIEVI